MRTKYDKIRMLPLNLCRVSKQLGGWMCPYLRWLKRYECTLHAHMLDSPLVPIKNYKECIYEMYFAISKESQYQLKCYSIVEQL